MFIFYHQHQCFKQHNPTPAQTLSIHSGEWHNLNLKTKRHHTGMIPSTPFHLLYLVCHVETNTIWAIVIWTILFTYVYYCSCWKQQDENSIKTDATLWHGRCQFKSHSLNDWQQWHFMVGRHLFSVLCLKLDLSLCPSPLKCLNICLDVSCHSCVLTLDILTSCHSYDCHLTSLE